MNTLQVLVAVAAGVILFLFGIEHFSREVQAISGQRFRRFLALATKNRVLAFLLGGAVTAVVQSSTATSVIAVGLVNAGVLSFRHSLGVVFGANVGTTVTAQLVALELTSFAPALILVGFFAGYAPFRWRVLGRSIFYFGLVFFSLELVSAAVKPLQSDPELMMIIARYDTPITALIVGALFTAVVQSSTVTTGVAIVLIERGLIPFSIALPLILGANVGTTITALLASSSLDTSARRTATSHALYNVAGVLLFVPFLGPFEALLGTFGQSPAATLATAHLLFNVTTSVLFLAVMTPFAKLVEWLIADDAHEAALPAPPAVGEDVGEALAAANTWVDGLIGRLDRAYVAAVLTLQTRDAKIHSRAERTASILRFGLEETQELVHALSRRTLDEESSRAILRLVVKADHVRQVLDSIDDLMALEAGLARRHARLSMEALLHVQAALARTAKLLDAVAHDPAAVPPHDAALVEVLEDGYRGFIELARDEREGGELADFLSIHQRLRTKVRALAAHLEEPRRQNELPIENSNNGPDGSD